MKNRKKFKIITLGCKVNQAESEQFRCDFLSADFREAPGAEKADFVIVNTCCVTSIAERKSRKAVRQAFKKFPSAKVWVTGCSVNLDKRLSEKIPGPADFFQNEDKEKLRQKISSLGRAEGKFLTSLSPRALLKVATGCNERCSYCVVPLVRGPVKSRSPEEILKEAGALIAAGKKEIILTAINLGLYGVDFKNNADNFKELLRKLTSIAGLMRLRLSSLEPMYFTDDLIEFLLGNPKICPHFYIPLQSGSPKILNLMGRRYSPQDFLKIAEKIKKLNPDVSLNSDVIVGFPGEDRSDFKETYEFIQKIGLSRIHVFPFSSRPGTLASKLTNQVPSREIKERCSKMNELRQKIMLDFHQKFVGRTVQVLAEEFHPETGLLEGLTENYLRVFFKASQNLVGEMVLLKLKKAAVEFLKGDPD